MKNKPKLLDAYCKAGGAGMGYHKADFDVTGVDIEPQPNYPFKFIQADAIHYIIEHGHEYDFIHTSPPCQLYSISTVQFRLKGKEYNDLVAVTRKALQLINKPYVIENVPQAPIRNDIVLMGHMFGLKVIRKRHFETSFFMLQPGIPKVKGTVKNGDYAQVLGKGQLKVTNGKTVKFNKGNVLDTWRYAMGIDWMKTNKELGESIPPAYTEYIGKQAIELLFTNKTQIK